MAGARPTITAVTDDASRGGLFVQSNIANPVSGADVEGNTVNDSTITLSVSINGDVQTGTFTTNQAADGTVSLVFTGIGDGVSPVTGGGNPVTGGTISADGNTLTLQLTNPPNVDIDITRLATDAELQAAINALNIPSNIEDLGDTPSSLGTPGQVLVVNSGGTALEWADPATAMVSASSFSSNDSTIAIGQNGAQVNLEARPEWTGNTNNGDNVGSAGVHAQNIILAADTGLILDNTGGQVTIRMADPAPPAAAAPTVTTPPGSSVIDRAPDQVVTFRPQGTDMVTMVDMVSVSGPNGPVTSATSDVTGGVGTVTIPQAPEGTMQGANSPGIYQINARVTTMTTGGETTQTTESTSINRFIPFFQSRTDMTTVTEVEAGVPSTDRFMANTGITSIAGSGILYFAVRSDDVGSTVRRAVNLDNTFRFNVGFLRSLSITLGDGTSELFNIFRIAGVATGVRIGNFS